jgi:hypothetical protein
MKAALMLRSKALHTNSSKDFYASSSRSSNDTHGLERWQSNVSSAWLPSPAQ